VVPGGEIQGIDISLLETKAVSITGKVFRADGKPAVEAMLNNMRIDEEDWVGWMSRGGRVDSEGNFKLGGLLPGRYRLMAESRRSEKPQMASLTVEVGNEDIRGVVLSLGDGGELSGNVIVEGGDVKSLPATMRVMLESDAGGRMMGFRMQGGEVLEDRSFTLRDVMEGSYRFRIFPPPTHLYLKSARIQGKDALDQAFDIRNGEKVTEAEIVLSADGGQISGAVKQEEGEEPVKGATVLLFSADSSRRGARSRWTRTTQSDQQGGFRLSGVAPGEYLACALLNHEAGTESSSEYLQELAKNAKSISVQPRSQLNESLVVQPAPAVE
jgi:hypothetical protein